uniref:Peptidase S1 domain-containing protein n=1 Tax=Peronospora matthiolae TaxID=2874970 RepID=A0AAV1TTT1_9STRA
MKIIVPLLSSSILIGPVAGIIGGNELMKARTYVAGIRTTVDPKSEDNFSHCGGVLITSTHVLTTASCAEAAPANFVSVGAYFVNGGEDGEEIKVRSVTKHPQFNRNTLSNDFAVLTLEKKCSKKPVQLPAPGGADIRSGMWVTAMGWGLTSASADAMSSEKLKELHQQIIPNDVCRKALKSTTIGMSHVCAGGQRGQSPCVGDMGGPVIRGDASVDGNDVLIGLIAGSDGCGVKQGIPAIYARVSSVLPWINSVVKNSK